MPEKSMSELRAAGENPPMRCVEVVPSESGGRISKLWTGADGALFAEVVFPDGRVEVHRVPVELEPGEPA